MMNKLKTIVLLLGIILSATSSLANSEFATKNDGGESILVICKTNHEELDRSNYIIASINGHVLTVSFLSNIGHVTIKITDASGATLDIESTETPTGYMYYIPSAGHYVVVFTFTDGDEYYAEFDVTD